MLLTLIVLRLCISLSLYTPAFDTTSPGDRAKKQTAAGFTAPRDSHPRQDLCRPPAVLQSDGSIIVSDGIIAKQPATDCFWTDGNRWAPYIQAALMESSGETCPLLMYPRFHRWSWRILRVACLSRQEAPSGTYLSLWIFCFQSALANANRVV